MADQELEHAKELALASLGFSGNTLQYLKGLTQRKIQCWVGSAQEENTAEEGIAYLRSVLPPDSPEPAVRELSRSLKHGFGVLRRSCMCHTCIVWKLTPRSAERREWGPGPIASVAHHARCCSLINAACSSSDPGRAIGGSQVVRWADIQTRAGSDQRGWGRPPRQHAHRGPHGRRRHMGRSARPAERPASKP